jgi:biotin synthase
MRSLPAIDTPQQALDLLSLPEGELFARAGALREAAFGHKIILCAIINARSGNCAMDCRFCSQSSHYHAAIDTFALLPDEVLRERILRLAAQPVARIGLVTSGAALTALELERLRKLIAALPPEIRSRVCTSLGRLQARSLQSLAAAGLQRYHHNLETSRDFYPGICSTQTWEQRRATVQHAFAAGLEVCTGGLFGLGESWEQRIAFAFSLRELGVRQVPMNFLHPQAGTPLGRQPILDAGEALRIIAVFRHILPQATLRVCGGRPLVLGQRQNAIFAAGANGLMTGDYLTTQGEALAADLAMIAELGLEVAYG